MHLPTLKTQTATNIKIPGYTVATRLDGRGNLVGSAPAETGPL